MPQDQTTSTAPDAEDSAEVSAEQKADRAKADATRDQELAKAKIVVTEARNWAAPLAKELAISSNDVDRAYAAGLNKLLVLADAFLTQGPEGMATAAESITAMDTQLKAELLNPRTSAAAKLLYLAMACIPGEAACQESLALNPLEKSDSNNGFVQLALAGYQIDLQRKEASAQRATNDAANDRKAAGEESAAALKKRRQDSEAAYKQAQLEHAKVIKTTLVMVTRYDDYSVEYKARIRLALKSRPIPETLLARLGPQYLMVSKFFPQEDLGAEVGGNIAVAIANSKLFELRYRLDEAGYAPLKRIADMAFNSPKSSFASLMAWEKFADEHPIKKTLDKYENFDKNKQMSVSLLLTTRWASLRPVLAKAVNQGDVAAIPDFVIWADAAIAAIPDKSAVQLAQEKADAEREDARAAAEVKVYEAMEKACAEEAEALKEQIKDSKQRNELRFKCVAAARADYEKRLGSNVDAAQLAATRSAEAAANEAAAAAGAEPSAAKSPPKPADTAPSE